MRTYAIVGFGTAGYHALKAIRRLDAGGTVDVYTNTGLDALQAQHLLRGW